MLSFDKCGNDREGHYWLMTVTKREFEKPPFCAKVLEFKENNEGFVRYVMDEVGECNVVDDLQGFVLVQSAFLPKSIMLRALLTNAADKQSMAKVIWDACDSNYAEGDFEFTADMWKSFLSRVEVPKEIWLTVVLDSYNRRQAVPRWAVCLQISEDNRFDHTFGSGPADCDLQPFKECGELYNALHVVEEPTCDAWSVRKWDPEKLVHMF